MSETWARYNSLDSVTDFKIWNQIEPDLDQQGYRNLYEDTMSLYPPILFMQTIGLKIDHNALGFEKIRIEDEMEKAQHELYSICGFDLNPNSPKQCQQYFYGALGHQPYLSPKGTITTDEKAMARLSRKGVKEAKYVITLRTLRKLLGTYVEVATDSDGRIRSSFNPRGTTGGRLSSSQSIFGTGLNFQNLHPQFKAFIVADKDRFFISMDKAQAEWVIMAYLCNDPKMIFAIENGEDIHAKTANEMTLIPQRAILEESKIIGKISDRDLILELRSKHIPWIFDFNARFIPTSMSLRQMGKKSNHGLNYKEGYWRFALENEIPEAEAKLYVNGYSDVYVNLPLYWEAVERKLNKNNRTLENCFEHKRRFLDEWGSKLVKSAIAYNPQSTSVWVVNYAMRDIYNDDTEPFKDLWLHAQVHDELLFSYPINKWREAAEVILGCEAYMTPTISYEGRSFRIKTDLAVGLNWGEASKENPDGMTKISLLKNAEDLAELLEGTHATFTQRLA